MAYQQNFDDFCPVERRICPNAPDRILLAQKKAPILERLARKSHYEAVAKSNSERTKQKTIVVQMDNDEKLAINQPTISPVSKPVSKVY